MQWAHQRVFGNGHIKGSDAIGHIKGSDAIGHIKAGDVYLGTVFLMLGLKFGIR